MGREHSSARSFEREFLHGIANFCYRNVLLARAPNDWKYTCVHFLRLLLIKKKKKKTEIRIELCRFSLPVCFLRVPLLHVRLQDVEVVGRRRVSVVLRGGLAVVAISCRGPVPAVGRLPHQSHPVREPRVRVVRRVRVPFAVRCAKRRKSVFSLGRDDD